MAEKIDLFKPLKEIQFVDRDTLKANDYNPNKVLEKNLKLLIQSILTNGFCFPIVCRPDLTIIDGFHRWTVSGREPLKTLLGGKVPIVIVAHEDESKNVYGTITFNRARGTHLLEPMENIVKELLEKATKNPTNYADFEKTKKILSKMVMDNYSNAIYQKTYQILISGDPKNREYRALLGKLEKENSNG